MGLKKNIISLTWLDEPCPVPFYLGWSKIKSPFDIDLQDKDEKNIFHEMTRFIIVIDDNSKIK